MKNYRTFSLIAIPAVIGFWTVIWAINTVFDGPVTPVPAAAELAGSITSQPAEPADWQSVLDTADFQASTDDTTLLEVDTDESIAEPIDSADAEELIFTSAGGSARQITAEELAAMTATTRSSSVQSRSSAGGSVSSGGASTSSSGLSSGLSGGGSSGGSGGGSAAGGASPSSDLSSQYAMSTASTSSSTNTSSPVTGGGGSSDAESLDVPKKLFMFAGVRNQSHFRILEFPKLRPLFAPDFVWHVSTFKSEAERARMIRLLRYFNKKTVIAYYHSACTTLPPDQDYEQPSKMPNDQLQDGWILKYENGNPVTWGDTTERFFLDMRKPEVRQAMISLAVSRAEFYGYDAISFDNCYWSYGVPASTGEVVSEEDWTKAFMKFYEEAGKAAHEKGLKCMVNVATKSVWRAFETIAPYVDGIMTEMPFHENVVEAGNVDRELAAYEKVAKSGTMVLLLQTYEGRGQETLDLARPLVDKYDNIYISIPEFSSHYFYHGRKNYDMSNAPPVSEWYRNPLNQ